MCVKSGRIVQVMVHFVGVGVDHWAVTNAMLDIEGYSKTRQSKFSHELWLQPSLHHIVLYQPRNYHDKEIKLAIKQVPPNNYEIRLAIKCSINYMNEKSP